MARSRKFTPVVVPQIESWADQGLSAVEIAEKIGCTVGTLRVRCSQFKISLRRGRSSERARDAVLGGPLCPHNDDSNSLGHAIDPDLGVRLPHRATPAKKLQIARGNEATSLRQLVDEGGEQLVISIPQLTVHQLQNWAALKGISIAKLAATLLETIVHDDLYEAVLDEN